MSQVASAEALCEVCAKATARKGDLLCGDCSCAFTLMLDLIRWHPEVDATDLDRIRGVFQWRVENAKAPNVTQIESGVRDEVGVSATLPNLPRGQTKTACGVCAKPLTEADNLLCPECSRAFIILLDLVRESAPLVQSYLDAHPELTAEDLDRIRRVFTWRSSRMGLGKPKTPVDIAVTS